MIKNREDALTVSNVKLFGSLGHTNLPKHWASKNMSEDFWTGKSGSMDILRAVEKAKLDGTVGFGKNELARQTALDSIIGNTAMGDLTKLATGGIIDEPIFGIGKSGRKYLMGESGSEMVTPISKMKNGNVVVNINIGRIEKDADFNQLKPMIQKWILEANSRRGMI